MLTFKTDTIENRPFVLGDSDCFSVVIKFFKINFDIDIPDFARPNDWNAEQDNLIEKLHKLAGFEKLDLEDNWPPRPADVIVVNVGSSVPNHLIVYLGNNEILHHKEGMLSGKELMRPAWKHYASSLMRHPQVPDLTPKKETITLEEIYREGLD